MLLRILSDKDKGRKAFPKIFIFQIIFENYKKFFIVKRCFNFKKLISSVYPLISQKVAIIQRNG
jgi:hypothetical protein